MAEKLWHGFRLEEFEFEGFQAYIAYPEKANEKKFWTIKTEYWDAFPETEIELLKRGWHVTYLKNETRWAGKSDCHRKARFVKYIHENYGLYEKCVPVGMSCGGCHAVNFAGLHPESVACMFIDAPVINFADHPGNIADDYRKKVWDTEFVETYPGIRRCDMLTFDNHPLHKAPTLIEHKIPTLLVYGTEDQSVDFKQHGMLFEECYTDHPELLCLIKCEGRGHHPHGIPENPGIIADWIEAHM